MKHFRKRILSAALSAAIAAGTLPAALALDTTPAAYEQFGYDSPEEFIDCEFYRFDYDQASDTYRRHLEAIHQNPRIALDWYCYADLAELDDIVADGGWSSREECYRYAALALTQDDQFSYTPPLSVELNGETVAFPAKAQPEIVSGRTMAPFRAVTEALGAQVGYDAGRVTASLDGLTYAFTLGGKTLTVTNAAGETVRTVPLRVAPYSRNGRTYVPVRFFAEAFGLSVQWDQYEQRVVIYDADALSAKLDEDFTTVNQWLAAQPERDAAKAMRTVAALDLAYTAFDSIDGDKKYQLSGTLSVLSEGQNAEVKLTADLRAIAQLMLQDEDSAYLDNVLLAALGLYENELKNASFDMILDADSGTIYLRCPLLFKFLCTEPEFAAEADMKALAAGAWLRFSDFYTLFGVSALTALIDLPALNMENGMTVGSLIVAGREADAALWDTWHNFYEDTLYRADSLAAIAGDDLFTGSGTRRTAKLNISAEDSLDLPNGLLAGGSLTGSYTLDLSTGAISGAVESRADEWYSASLTRCAFEADSKTGKLTLSVHTKNVGILELTLTLSSKESATGPALAPPDGSKIIDADEFTIGEAAADIDW